MSWRVVTKRNDKTMMRVQLAMALPTSTANCQVKEYSLTKSATYMSMIYAECNEVISLAHEKIPWHVHSSYQDTCKNNQ